MPNNFECVEMEDIGPELDTFSDKSLTELLAPTPSACSYILSNGNSEDRSTRVVPESQFEEQSRETARLCNHVEILESEIDRFKKVQNAQTAEIKRLTSENDKLRRELSRRHGIRKFVTTIGDDEGGQNNPEDGERLASEELNLARVKLQSLKEHMKDIAGSMLEVLDEGQQGPFTLVSSRRRKRNRSVDPATNSQTQPAAAVEQCLGMPIPVLQVGSTISDRTDGTQGRESYSDVCRKVPAQRRRVGAAGDKTSNKNYGTRTQTVVIGSSLVRGLGPELAAQGVNATCYTYPGATIPVIRKRVGHILTERHQPRQIVLQCGGNDLEAVPTDRVVSQYDALIREIRQRCPSATIVLSKIPLRKHNVELHRKIDMLNTYLENRGKRGDGVIYVTVTSDSLAHFKHDLVHFNTTGVKVFGRRLAACLKNFHWSNMRASP